MNADQKNKSGKWGRNINQEEQPLDRLRGSPGLQWHSQLAGGTDPSERASF